MNFSFNGFFVSQILIYKIWMQRSHRVKQIVQNLLILSEQTIPELKKMKTKLNSLERISLLITHIIFWFLKISLDLTGAEQIP